MKTYRKSVIGFLLSAAITPWLMSCSTPMAKRTLASEPNEPQREVRTISTRIEIPVFNPKVFQIGTKFSVKSWNWSIATTYITSIGIADESKPYFDCPTVSPASRNFWDYETPSITCAVRKLGAKDIVFVFVVQAKYPGSYRFDSAETTSLFDVQEILENYPTKPLDRFDFERLMTRKIPSIVSTQMTLEDVVKGKRKPFTILPVNKKGDTIRISGATGRIELRRKEGKVYADVNESGSPYSDDLKTASGRTRRSLLKLFKFLRPMKDEAPYSVVCKFIPAQAGKKQVIYKSTTSSGYFVLPEDGQVVCQANYRTTGLLAAKSGFFNVQFTYAEGELLEAAKSHNTAMMKALLKKRNDEHFKQIAGQLDSKSVKEYVQEDLTSQFKDQFASRSNSIRLAAEQTFRENVIVRTPHVVDFAPQYLVVKRISGENRDTSNRTDFYSIAFAAGTLGAVRGYFNTGNSSNHVIEKNSDLVAFADYLNRITPDQALGQGLELLQKLGSIEVVSAVYVLKSGLPGETSFTICADKGSELQKRLDSARTKIDHDEKSMNSIMDGLGMTQESEYVACRDRMKQREIILGIGLDPVVKYSIKASASDTGALKLSPAGANLVFSTDQLFATPWPAVKVTYPLSILSRDFGPWFESEATLGSEKLGSNPVADYLAIFGDQARETSLCYRAFRSIDDLIDASTFLSQYYQKSLLDWLKEGMICYGRI